MIYAQLNWGHRGIWIILTCTWHGGKFLSHVYEDVNRCHGHWSICKHRFNVAPMSPTMYEFSSSDFLCFPNASHQVSAQSLPVGADVVSRFSRWPSWILKQNEFSNCKSTSLPNASHQVYVHSTYRSGADVVWRFSRWPPWRPSWISERNDFSHSETLCCSNASHQVSAQSGVRFWRRRRLKIFKMADMATILDIEIEWF